MFEITRLKLTAWYLMIIMIISVLFSIAFYQASTRELERVINRIEFRQYHPDEPMPERELHGNPSPRSLKDLEQSKRQILLELIAVNAGILLLAGIAGYFLAGRTLRPIKEMMDEQNQFISNASHELRTPIATLRAEMEGSLLEKHITDKQARDLITSNLEELGTLQDLTNNLLLLAQIPTATQGKAMETVSLLEVIKKAEKKVLPLAKNKAISIQMNVQDLQMQSEKTSLIEVFVTLLDNAIKYSPKGKTIEITSKEQQKHVSIAITDQGIGISEEDLPHIFERFYRADKSRSQADGYGLGLSIAKRIIESHDGTINVSSQEGKGTTFTITLPH